MQSHAFLRRCSIITVAMRDSADRDLQQWVSGLGLRDASSPWNWVELSFIDNWLLQTLSSQLTAKLAAKVPPHRHPLYLVSYATPPHPPSPASSRHAPLTQIRRCCHIAGRAGHAEQVQRVRARPSVIYLFCVLSAPPPLPPRPATYFLSTQRPGTSPLKLQPKLSIDRHVFQGALARDGAAVCGVPSLRAGGAQIAGRKGQWRKE
jgi:hypothetical protein